MLNNKFILGGWSQSLLQMPLRDFDIMMYGMITNLNGLSTGTEQNPGWYIKLVKKPETSGFNGKVLWTYGGGGCSPEGGPSSLSAVSEIIKVTQNGNWDGVDFDNECNMNIDLVIQTMEELKNNDKTTSFGFIAGYSYNHPNTSRGEKINNEIKQIISSNSCDYLIHYCYGQSMWNDNDIKDNVNSALKRSISYGIESKKCILALTTKGLNDWNLNYFINQIIDLNLGGLFIWNFEALESNYLKIIKERLIDIRP